MLKLHGHLPILQAVDKMPYLATVTKEEKLSADPKRSRALLVQPGANPQGFKAILTKTKQPAVHFSNCDVFEVGNEYEYLDEGDIIRLDPNSGSMRCLYRRNSLHNTLLLTEQCDHYCLMCSQPPKRIDDSWLLTEATELISLIPAETKSWVSQAASLHCRTTVY